MKKRMTVYNTCFNGHEWQVKQKVDVDTGVTNCNPCPECGGLIQLQSIPEYKG